MDYLKIRQTQLKKIMTAFIAVFINKDNVYILRQGYLTIWLNQLVNYLSKGSLKINWHKPE